MIHIKESIDRVQKQGLTTMPTGLKFLDDSLGGLYPGEMTIICGDADDGKTALMIRQIHRLAIEEEIPVMIVLNGMSERTFLACMTAYYCSIITDDVHRVYSDIVYKDDVKAYWHILEKKPVYIVDSKDLPEKETVTLKQFVSDHGIKVLFFEQASCMKIFGWESSKAGFYLKQLAIELQVAVLAEYELWNPNDECPIRFHFFNEDNFSNFADNVIGIIDFANHQVFVDENGNDLRGYIRMKIMKHKGVVSSGKDAILAKIELLCKNK